MGREFGREKRRTRYCLRKIDFIVLRKCQHGMGTGNILYPEGVHLSTVMKFNTEMSQAISSTAREAEARGGGRRRAPRPRVRIGLRGDGAPCAQRMRPRDVKHFPGPRDARRT
jgi:hypothetical protein